MNQIVSHISIKTAVLLVLASLAFGCGTFSVNPVTAESRAVYGVNKEVRTLTILSRQTFHDSKAKVYSLTIPKGAYTLEAQDEDYWYFKAPTLLERSTYDGKTVVDSNVFVGGIMIGKKNGMMVPAGVYKSDGSLNMLMIWKFGQNFMKGEGTTFKKSW